MTDLWVYRVDVVEVPATAPDLTDFEAYSMDGHHVGDVDEASEPTRGGFIVVDTGWWIFGKKRMIPVGTISSIDLDERQIYLSVSKDQLKDAPDFDDARRDQEEYRREHTEHYAAGG